MLGTTVNFFTIITGSIIGLLFKKKIKEEHFTAVNKSMGLAIIIVGFNGVISNMFTVSNGKISSSGELLLIISLALGALVGTALKIDDRLRKISTKIEKKLNMGDFAIGFSSATIIFCVGAMAIVGALNDGLRNDHSTLFIKSTLDGITSIVLASTLGIGVAFSAFPVFIYQGAISLLSGLIGGFLTGNVLTGICMVGNAIIIAIGLSFWKKDFIKPANMLPAILIPPFYELFKWLFQMIFSK